MKWFRTVRVRKECLLSPTLFIILIEQILSDALEEHAGKFSISSRNFSNLQFADDIDAVAETEQEQELKPKQYARLCQMR